MSAHEYFRQREEELLKLNAKLEEQKYKILTETPAEENIRPTVPVVTGVGIGTDTESLQSTVRYQKARIAALQEELERLHTVAREKDAEMASLRVVVKEQTEETKRLLRRISGIEGDLEKATRKSTALESRLKVSEEELDEKKKQQDTSEVTIRKLENQIRTSEVKMSRMAEENERLRGSIKEIKTMERDKVTVEKDQVEKIQNDVKRLTKQRNELINAFKKQAKLVDVLRRQKAHIEASRLLNFTEEEFNKLLTAGTVADSVEK